MNKTVFFKKNPRNLKSHDLDIGMNHLGLKVYTFSMNDDPGLTMTYFMAKSSLVKIAYWLISGPHVT